MPILTPRSDFENSHTVPDTVAKSPGGASGREHKSCFVALAYVPSVPLNILLEGR